MITEIVSFCNFHSNHREGDKFLQHYFTVYQSKQALKERSQTDKDFSKKIVSSFRLQWTKILATKSKSSKIFFTYLCHITEWI